MKTILLSMLSWAMLTSFSACTAGAANRDDDDDDRILPETELKFTWMAGYDEDAYKIDGIPCRLIVSLDLRPANDLPGIDDPFKRNILLRHDPEKIMKMLSVSVTGMLRDQRHHVPSKIVIRKEDKVKLDISCLLLMDLAYLPEGKYQLKIHMDWPGEHPAVDQIVWGIEGSKFNFNILHSSEKNRLAYNEAFLREAGIAWRSMDDVSGYLDLALEKKHLLDIETIYGINRILMFYSFDVGNRLDGVSHGVAELAKDYERGRMTSTILGLIHHWGKVDFAIRHIDEVAQKAKLILAKIAKSYPEEAKTMDNLDKVISELPENLKP